MCTNIPLGKLGIILKYSYKTSPCGRIICDESINSKSPSTRSWKNFKSCKILIIKYEDMVLNELNTFTKVINYLSEIDKIEFNSNKLEKALKQTQFKELQKLEKTEGFEEKGKSEFFFRKGKIGGWKNEVSSSLINKIEKLFKNEMEELGYL